MRDRPEIWLLQDGEPLPTDESPRLMRTGNLAASLVDAGFIVTWWTSRFNHSLKKYRTIPAPVHHVGQRFRICALDGPSYPSNLSLRRIRHYRALAAAFTTVAAAFDTPDLVLGSLPSPELCSAGARFAKRHGVPFVVDIRDPWPDIFPGYVPAMLRWGMWPLLQYYRRHARSITRSADRIIAVSESMLNWGIEYSGRERRSTDAVFFIGYNKPPIERDVAVPMRFTEASPLICLFATTCGTSYDGATLVDAARILESSGERRVRFVVSGDGEQRQRWIDQARGLTMVHFTGWISHEELQAHFYKAHVGLILLRGGITSFWLGNKFAEYLSTSLALINNVSGEASRTVEAHGLGLNVDARDPRALADAIRTFVNSPDAVQQSMANSQRVFNEMFERRQLYKRYVGFLDDALRSGRRRERAAVQ